MTVTCKDYWNKKQFKGIDIVDVIKDYVVDGINVNELEHKYHSSRNRVLELLKYVGVLRSKSEALNRSNAKNENLSSFINIPNSVMQRIAESGVNKSKLSSWFGISLNSKSFINKIESSKYDNHYHKVYVKNMNEKTIWKAKYLRSIDRSVFEVLSSNFRDVELSNKLNISNSFLTHLYKENNINDANRNTRDSYYQNGYSEMYNCGASVYRYNN